MARKAHGRRGLSTWLTNSRTPVFVLDARRMVLVFNRGCEELTGWSAADVVGQVCDYATETDRAQVESITGCLCPPPEVLDGDPRRVDVAILRRDGTSLQRCVHFLPLRADEESRFRILGVITAVESATPLTAPSVAGNLHLRLSEAQVRLRQQFDSDAVIACGPHMQRVLAQVRIARGSDASVHFAGERGVGKEHVARMIHYGSERRLSSFVPLECAALPAFDLKRTVRRLLESARDDEPSEFALRPGAVYLDLVGALPRDVQELLVEACRPDARHPAGLRLFSADTSSIESLVATEALLPELYCLLTSITIDIPPLRERADELPLLAQQLLETLNRDQERQVSGFAADVLLAFREYRWPGNVDELRSVVEEARSAATSATIQSRDLPFWFRAGVDAQTLGPSLAPQPRPLAPYLAEVEAEQIRWALDQARNNKSLAADLLGLTRARLYRRMEALGIEDGGTT
jgi:PAS domain S-box-containing protein